MHVHVRVRVCECILTNIYRVKSQLDDEHFMTFHHFPDTLTLQLIGAASDVLGENLLIKSNCFNSTNTFPQPVCICINICSYNSTYVYIYIQCI